jgi:hypothetical protein
MGVSRADLHVTMITPSPRLWGGRPPRTTPSPEPTSAAKGRSSPTIGVATERWLSSSLRAAIGKASSSDWQRRLPATVLKVHRPGSVLSVAAAEGKTLCRPVRCASAFGQSREAVGAPAFAAHAVMDEEEAIDQGDIGRRVPPADRPGRQLLQREPLQSALGRADRVPTGQHPRDRHGVPRAGPAAGGDNLAPVPRLAGRVAAGFQHRVGAMDRVSARRACLCTSTRALQAHLPKRSPQPGTRR